MMSQTVGVTISRNLIFVIVENQVVTECVCIYTQYNTIYLCLYACLLATVHKHNFQGGIKTFDVFKYLLLDKI